MKIRRMATAAIIAASLTAGGVAGAVFAPASSSARSITSATSVDGRAMNAGASTLDGTRRCAPGKPVLTVAAKAIGVSTESLAADLKDGDTIADVAAANGVKSSAVVDALVADAATHINQEVTDGHLTQTRADDMIAGLRTHIEAAVNGTDPLGLPPGGPMGGTGGMGGPAGIGIGAVPNA